MVYNTSKVVFGKLNLEVQIGRDWGTEGIQKAFYKANSARGNPPPI